MGAFNGLTGKQAAFVEAYLQCWNGTEAARRAGYNGDDASLAVIASVNLRKVKIREAIESRLESETMTTNELLWRFRERARFDIGEYLIPDGDGFAIDVNGLIEDGKGHLIRNIVDTRYGQKVELTNPDDAQKLIGQHLGLFKDGIEHSGKVEHTIKPDFSQWDLDELRDFVRLAEKAERTSGKGTGDSKPD